MICLDCKKEFTQKCVELYCKDCLQKRIDDWIAKLQKINEEKSSFYNNFASSMKEELKNRPKSL